MTLAVSLRVPDGLVIAADSLSTTRGQLGITAEWKGACPECKKNIQVKDISLPPIPIPASVSSFAQKVFPFLNVYGIATYGTAILNEKTIYYHVKTLEDRHLADGTTFVGVTDIANELIRYFDTEVKKHFKNIEKAPDDFVAVGFLVAGYDAGVGKTIVLKIGKKSKKEEYTGSGCSYGGDGHVVQKLWELAATDPGRATKYAAFSLQDAVDYAEYLINSTANFQRFANMIPSVGGAVDVGLITPFRKFTWIKCKELTSIIE